MQLKEYSFRLDIKKKKDIEYIEVVQGDTGTNVFNITLFDGYNPYNLYNLHVEIIFKKADGTTVEQNDIEKVNDVQGKIRCVLKTNTIAYPGKVIAELKILDNEKMLTSTTFEFWVRKSLLNDETIESTNEFPILTQLINETHDLIETVRQIEEQVPENVVVKLNQLEETTNGLVTAFGDKIDKSSIANNTVTTVAGLVLDARQGKALQDQVNGINNNLGGWTFYAALYQINASFNEATPIETIILAMPDKSILQWTVPGTPNTDVYPTTGGGHLIIEKQSIHRISCRFNRTWSGGSSLECYIGAARQASTPIFSGWKRINLA